MNGQEEFSDRSSVVAEVDRLLAALDRNDISQPEADRLQFLVCHDGCARERYIRSVNLKASLEWDAVSAALVQNGLPAGISQNPPHDEPAAGHQGQLAIENTPTIPLVPLSGMTSTGLTNASAPSVTSSIVHWLGRPSSFLMLAFVLTASVAVIVASGLLAPSSPSVEMPLAQERRTKQTIAPLAPSVEAPPSVAAPPLVARLTGVNNAVWREGSASLNSQDLLKVDQRLDLVGGFAEVTFECGAVVMLSAPASVVIKAPNGGKIEFGKITARVPGPSAKFWIQTPNNHILDLGTEFGVSVDAAGVEQICVFDGAIEVDSEQRVNGRKKTLLRTGEVVHYGPQGERISGSEIGIDLEDSFVRTMPSSYESDYVQEILSAQPVGYWSFNSVIASALVPDVSGNGRFGYMKGNATIAQGGPVLAIGQAMALDGRRAYVSIPAAASLSLAGDFSMEVLFRTASAGPLISKVSNDGTWCAGAKMLFIRGGAVRFTPDSNIKGKSLRAVEYVNDGQWHHVVLTNKARGKGKKDVTILYLDGVERARRDDWIINHENDETMPIKIGVACKKYPLPPNTAEAAYFPSRSYFPGYLDEIAIYNRVLLPREAKAHYRAYIHAGLARRQMAPDFTFDSLKDSFPSGDTVIESDWMQDEEALLEEEEHAAP